MGIISHIDGPNRDIYLSVETVGSTVHPIDIYKEMRTLRRNDEELRKYDVFLSAYGNVPKGGGKATERYVICNSGTKIIPYNATHVLTINGTILTDDGKEGVDCFNRAPLDDNMIVDINYIPPQVEVITVYSTGGLTNQNITDITDNIFNRDMGTVDTRPNSFGTYIKNKLLTVPRFLSLFKK